MKRKKIQFKIMLISLFVFSMNSYAQQEIVQSNCNPIENFTIAFDEANKTVYLDWNAHSKKMIRVKPAQEEIVEEQMFLPTDIVFRSFNANNKNILINDPIDRSDDWMMWCGQNNSGIDVACLCDIIVAARFTPTDLEAFGVLSGDKITKVRFVPCSNNNPHTLHIYEGGTSPTDPGVLKYEQEITETLIEFMYNEIELNTPFVIDVSKELWIAYRVVSYLGIVGCDAGPGVVNKGDLIYVDRYSSWYNLYSLGFDVNWNIDAYVATLDTRYTYNVYRNNMLIASNLKDTHYTDDVAVLDNGNYEYCVVAVLFDCESEQVCKGVSIELGIKEIYEEISIFPNPTTGELRIKNCGFLIENVEIFDVYGRKIVEQEGDRRKEKEINISHLRAGIYFVRIETETGIIMKKIIKY